MSIECPGKPQHNSRTILSFPFQGHFKPDVLILHKCLLLQVTAMCPHCMSARWGEAFPGGGATALFAPN